MSEEMKSWEIKDAQVCPELIALIGITEEDKAALAALKGEAEAVAGAMVADFHGRLVSQENTKEYFESVDVERIGGLVKNWFIELFGGTYDHAYAEKRLVIGQTHVRIGLPVRYPLAMIDVVLQHGEAVAKKAADPEKALSAFKKILALDVAIFNQAYEDKQLNHLSELVGGERLARRLLRE